jgi:hypothetical protein
MDAALFLENRYYHFEGVNAFTRDGFVIPGLLNTGNSNGLAGGDDAGLKNDFYGTYTGTQKEKTQSISVPTAPDGTRLTSLSSRSVTTGTLRCLPTRTAISTVVLPSLLSPATGSSTANGSTTGSCVAVSHRSAPHSILISSQASIISAHATVPLRPCTTTLYRSTIA